MLSFLSKANVYQNVSAIVQLEIQSRYPAVVKDNIILLGVANKIVDVIVTPQLVEKVAQPALTLSVKFAQSPTEILNNKVVVETAQYKSQVKSTISELGLPELITVNVNYIIDSLPSQMTLVDLDNHPNSVFGIIIKARTLLQYNKAALSISWVVIILTAIAVIGTNLHNVRRIFEVAWVAFGIGAVVLLGIFFVLPSLLSLALANDSGSLLIVAQNKLVTDAVSYLLSQLKNIAVVYAVIGVVSFLLWRFLPFEKVQKHVNKTLHVIHAPQVSVKVKV